MFREAPPDADSEVDLNDIWRLAAGRVVYRE
jgi:hypothetical protein